MQITKASLAVGQNCPVSIELMVFLDTPTILASSSCDRSSSLRYSFNLFFNTSESSISHTSRIDLKDLADRDKRKHQEYYAGRE